MNKKAISPLISTLLLIFFAVALGLVVMSWGKTAQLEEAESCDEISMDIMKIQEQEICYKDSILKYTVENTGSAAISRIMLFIMSDEIEKTEQEAHIAAADIINLESGYKTEDIKKIKITPGIEETFCPKKGVEVDIINECR